MTRVENRRVKADGAGNFLDQATHVSNRTPSRRYP